MRPTPGSREDRIRRWVLFLVGVWGFVYGTLNWTGPVQFWLVAAFVAMVGVVGFRPPGKGR